MEPVEIDFIIGGNVEGEGGKVVRSLDEITQAGKRAVNDAKKAVAEQSKVIKDIEKYIRDTEKKIKNIAPSSQKWDLISEVNTAKRVLEEEKGLLEQLKQKVDETANSHRKLSTRINETKDAMAKLEFQGKRGSEEWNLLNSHLGELSEQMRDTTRQAQVLGDDQRGFRALASGVSGLAGAMSAAVGVASIFGSENEDLIKIQTRLQSVMAITIGLQQVAETMSRRSYFSTVALTNAKSFLTIKTYQLATAFNISAAAARVWMGVMTFGLSAAISVAIVLFERYNRKQREAAQIKKEYEELRKDAIKGATSEIEKVQSLERAASNLKKPMSEREKALKELNRLMPEYNGHLDKETGKLVANKDALLQYITALANAEVAKKLAMKNAERTLEIIESQELERKYESGEEKAPVKYVAIGRQVGGSITGYVQNAAPTEEEKRKAERANIDEAVRLEKEKREKLTNEIEKTNEQIKKLYEAAPLPTPAEDEDKPRSSTTQSAEYDHEKVISEKLAELRQQTARLQIEQMQDGLEKRLAQIDHEGATEVAKVAEVQQKIVDEYNKARKDKKGFVPATSIADIDPQAAKQFEDEIDKIKADTQAKREKAAEEHQQKILDIARKYADERVQIEHDYNEDIKQLEAAGETDAANRARAARDKAKSEATAQIIIESEAYRLAMDDRLLVSAEVTEKLIEDIKRRVETEIAAGNMAEEQGRKIIKSLNSSSGATGSTNNPFKALLNGLKQYKQAKKELDEKRETATPEELAELEDAANKSLQATAAIAATVLSGINDVIATAIGAMDELIGMDDQQKKDAEDIMGMIGGAADIAAGIASGNPMQVIQGAIGFIGKAASFFDFKSKRIKKEQNKIIEQVNELGRAYNRLQREVEKALGTAVFDKQRAAIENLKRQIQEYYRLIELENKKKKKKRNQEAIDEWKQAIADAQAQMEAILDNIREQLTGTTTKTMAGDLANALVSAFQEGKDAAEAFGAVFDDVIRNAVLNAFQLRYLDTEIDKWLNMLADYMGDGVLSDWEQSALEDFKNQIYEQSQAGWDAISGMFDMGSLNATGIQGDVKNMTEDTGTALVGAINGMRINVDAILKNYKPIVEMMDKFSRHLEKIEENTEFCKKLENMDETLTDMKINGIKIK